MASSFSALSRWTFQSTLSVRRATRQCRGQRRRVPISIHALREESDDDIPSLRDIINISIHALREESDHGVLLLVHV